MSSQTDFIQPPRLAVWLVSLFAPAEQSESITGDLVEEFSELASRSGVALARRWFWREAVKTIADLAASGFRTAPWLMAAAVIGGFFLIGFASRFSAHAIRTFLDAHRAYESHPEAYLFWMKFPMLTGRVILCTLIGALVALVAKGRELTAAGTLALVEIVLFASAVFVVIASGQSWVQWFLDMLPWNCASAFATVIGGAVVRMGRSGGVTRPV